MTLGVIKMQLKTTALILIRMVQAASCALRSPCVEAIKSQGFAASDTIHVEVNWLSSAMEDTGLSVM